MKQDVKGKAHYQMSKMRREDWLKMHEKGKNEKNKEKGRNTGLKQTETMTTQYFVIKGQNEQHDYSP